MTISRGIINIFGIISIISMLLSLSLYLFRSLYIYVLKMEYKSDFHIQIQRNINSILPFLTKYHNLFWFICTLSSCIWILYI
jgi:hypothetical protein